MASAPEAHDAAAAEAEAAELRRQQAAIEAFAAYWMARLLAVLPLLIGGLLLHLAIRSAPSLINLVIR